MGLQPYLVLFSFLISSISADVYSCGGFVRSDSPIDYSKVTVKLLTTEGHLKHEEEVNPSNGYFMIPVYSKGKYSLKVSSPAGYHFEPSTYQFKLDGVNDPCSKNEDIIFKLNGFSIRGQVDGASAGLNLVLLQNGKKIDKTVTGDNGKYELKAPAGEYEVSTGAGTSECISRGKTSVKVAGSPVSVTPNLKISGYQLNIFAETTKKQAIENVDIILFSKSVIDLPNVGCKKSEKAVEGVPSSHPYQCNFGKTNNNGKLNVACVPSNDYYLRATLGKINFAPQIQKITVSQKSEEVKIVGESISSEVRVVSKGKPLKNIEVSLNSQIIGTTDSNGFVQVNNLKEGKTNVLTAKADHIQFANVNVDVKFPHVKIDDISVLKFDICGTVEKSENGVIDKITFTNKENKKSLNVVPKADGKFCQAVSPGILTVEPLDKSSSLTPKSLTVDVSNKPVTDLRFTHFKTDARIKVTCIGACQTSTVSLYLSGNTLIRSVQGTDVFVFENIGPGKYTAKLNDNGRGCWQESELQLTVEQSTKQPTINFVQSGFAAKIDVTQPAAIKWSHVDSQQLNGETQSPGGVVSICLPMAGKYVVELESCYKFEHQQFDLVVPFDGIHRERAIAAKVGGKIDLEGDKSGGVSIKVRSSEGEQEISVGSDGRFSFDQTLTGKQNDILHLVPISVKRLFEPTSTSIKFSGKCIDQAVEFKSYRGIYIDGTIRPPVEKVAINAVLRADNSVQINTISDGKGNYKIGPVKRVEDYDITATLDGFKFIPSNKAGNFESVKLSQLSIKVIDEITNEPLDGVLLSLVGGKGAGNGYRSNNVLDSTAEKRFVALAPGEYFVRAILQEYKFTPTTTSIEVHEGKHENLILKGKRVSFSVFGKIREMSAAPVSDVIVEALSSECDQHQSEATTGRDGSFRLRGLLPGCKYSVYAKAFADGTSAPHSFPKQFNVDMTAEDVKGLDFIVSAIGKTTDVAVEIDMTTLRGVQSVRVTVNKGHNFIQSTVIQYPQTLFYLSHLPRDGEEYSIRVEPEKPAQLFAAKTAFFTADVSVRIVRIPLTSSKKASEVDISIGSLLSLPFFILLALAFFNQNRVLDILRALYNFATAPNPTGDNQRKRK